MSVWQFVRTRKQVRKRNKLWEVVAFDGRSWVPMMTTSSFTKALWMATGDERLNPGKFEVQPRVVWQP